ncbi:MAG: ABC transporter ATP-binding protein, partial [Erysipelotrichaceae bacterium]|nr:ABC transporter ATP-binding protein [Erysipelotrichaceae bacterium]
MIEFKNISKSYRKGTKAVDDLSFTVNDGEIFGFLGPNGAGKSTTIRMLTGILGIDEGQILLDGHDISKDPLNAKKTFGYVADDPDQFLTLKGIEYLNFMADIYDVKDRKEKIETLTKRFEIFDALKSRIESYSHGMRQKIII